VTEIILTDDPTPWTSSFFPKIEKSTWHNQARMFRLTSWIVFFAKLVFFLIMMSSASASIFEAETLHKQLDKFLAANAHDSDIQALQRFYSARHYQPVWLLSKSTSALHDVALEFIENAESEGLDISDYQINRLRQLRTNNLQADAYELEFQTTRTLLKLATDLRRGQFSPKDLDPDWHIPQSSFDPVNFLLTAIASDNFQQFLDELKPKIPGYQLLKQALAKYRDLAARQAIWIQIPAAAAIHPNTMHMSIPLVRDRIVEAYKIQNRAEYNLSNTTSKYYDDNLVNAVKTFQLQHGLNPDGIIGRNTLHALNKTFDEKVLQLRLNLERLRWLPRQLGKRYLLANTAGFRLAAVKDDQQILNMRIVVGRNSRTTPSFSSHITHLVLNPYWNIPAGIARKDLLPHQQKDRNYFAARGIKVYRGYDYSVKSIDPDSVDWAALKNRLPYVLRQDPGVKNALGTIKFLLPNPFNIYLHDTPSKSLFSKEIRTFSSGCIRLEQPMELAVFAMNGHSTPAKLMAQINSGNTASIKLPAVLPIYIVYLTVWIDQQQNIRFSPDSYGWDKRALSFVSW